MFLDEKPQGAITEAPAKITKLSQAIRIGARIRPQCYERFYTKGGSCAIGAAWEAIYGRQRDDPRTADLMVPTDILHTVECMNDGKDGYARHTREAIADWLEAQGF